MMQKGQVPILIMLGILVIAVIAGGAYYLGRSTSIKPSPAPVTTSQTSQASTIPSDANREPTASAETTDWKTYTDSKNQFSIKYYPLAWKVVQPVGMDPFVVSFQHSATSVYIHVDPAKIGETLTSYLEDTKNKSGSTIDQVIDLRRYKIDNVEVEKSVTEEPSGKSGQVSVFAVNNGRIYQLIMPYKADNKQTYLEIFEQMLTTLKFLE